MNVHTLASSLCLPQAANTAPPDSSLTSTSKHYGASHGIRSVTLALQIYSSI